jgi:Arc/MetJ-type ribon-helix-helix transcriptional regulator
METLNVEVNKETKEKLETLVRKKLYMNTSEAERKMLAEPARGGEFELVRVSAPQKSQGRVVFIHSW